MLIQYRFVRRPIPQVQTRGGCSGVGTRDSQAPQTRSKINTSNPSKEGGNMVQEGEGKERQA
jgi:hypothetical protein